MKEVDEAEAGIADQIARMWGAGDAVEAISKELRIPRGTVERALIAHGLRKEARRRGGGAPIASEEGRELALRNQRGEAVTALARERSVTPKVVHNAIVRAGFRPVPHRGSPSPLSGYGVLEACRLWDEGSSAHAICRRLQVSRRAVVRALESRGRKVVARYPRGSQSVRWKDNPRRVSRGYVWVHPTPGFESMATGSAGMVLEHRLVMAEAIGRPLTGSETVHHLNGDRRDNRLNNLQLRQGAHGPGVVMRCRRCGSFDIECDELGDAGAETNRTNNTKEV